MNYRVIHSAGSTRAVRRVLAFFSPVPQTARTRPRPLKQQTCPSLGGVLGPWHLVVISVRRSWVGGTVACREAGRGWCLLPSAQFPVPRDHGARQCHWLPRRPAAPGRAVVSSSRCKAVSWPRPPGLARSVAWSQVPPSSTTWTPAFLVLLVFLVLSAATLSKRWEFHGHHLHPHAVFPRSQLGHGGSVKLKPSNPPDRRRARLHESIPIPARRKSRLFDDCSVCASCSIPTVTCSRFADNHAIVAGGQG